MNETYVSVVGNVVADPDRRVTTTGQPFTTFRIASTIRRPSRDGGEYEDGPTSFYNVIAFRNLATNVVAAVHKGEPVFVYGRQRVNVYTRGDGSTGVSVEIEAVTVGHDLTKGTTTFLKGIRPKPDPNDRMTDANVRSAQQDWEHPAYTMADGEDAGVVSPDSERELERAS